MINTVTLKYGCGFVNLTNDTVIEAELPQGITTWEGEGDGLNNGSKPKCSYDGKLWFIAADEVTGLPRFLIRATRVAGVPDTITLSIAELPEINEDGDLPIPNQLTVDKFGAVYFPGGATLDDAGNPVLIKAEADEDPFTINYIITSMGTSFYSSSHCVTLSKDHAYVVTYATGLGLHDGIMLFDASTMLLEGGISPGYVFQTPYNMETDTSGGLNDEWSYVILIGVGEGGTNIIVSFHMPDLTTPLPICICYGVDKVLSVGERGGQYGQGVVYTMERYERSPIGNNEFYRYTPQGAGVLQFLSNQLFTNPMYTPTHHDINRLSHDDLWTGSAITPETDGEVRKAVISVGDSIKHERDYYVQVATACEREPYTQPTALAMNISAPLDGDHFDPEEEFDIVYTSVGGYPPRSVGLRYSTDPIVDDADYNAATPIASGQPGSGTYGWEAPSDADTYYIRGRVADGDGFTALSNQVSIIVDNPVDYFVFDAIENQEMDAPFDITIRAMDYLGNPDPLYNGTANLTDTTGTIIPVTATFVAGVCTIEVTIEDAQSGEVITATDGAITGDSDPFEVEEMLYAELEVKGAMLGEQRTRQTYDLAALGHGPAAPTEGAFGSAVCPLGTFAGSHFQCDTRGYLYVTDKTTGVVTQYDIWTLLSQNFDPYDICFKGNPDTTGFIVIVGRNESTFLPSVVIATVESGVLVFYGPYDQTAVGLGYFLGCADNIGDDNFFVTESGNGPGATPGSVHVLKITATNNPAPPPRYSLITVTEDTGSPFQTVGADLFNPCDIACDAADHAWFIDTLVGPPHRLNEIAYAGAGTTVTEHAVPASIFSPYTTSGTGRAPSRLVVDATGNVWITGYNPGPNKPMTIEYVLATGNFAIQEWSTFTPNSTFAGIAIGANGHLYMMVYGGSGARFVMELDNNWQWYYNIHAWVPNAYAFLAPYTGYPLFFTCPKDNPIDPVTNDMWIGDGNASSPAIVTRMHLTDPYQDIAVPTLGTAIEVREITIISSISADVFVGFVSLGRIGECVAGKATHIKTSKTGAVNEHLGVFSNTAGANVLTEFVIRVIVGYKEV